MPRPVRKKQLPNKLDPNLFITSWKSHHAEQHSVNINIKKSTRSQGAKKILISSTPHVVGSKLRSEIDTDSSQNTVLANERSSILKNKTNISVEMKGTRKRSSRLETKSTEEDNSMNKSNEKVEKRRCWTERKSPERNRDARIRKRNKSRENDSRSGDRAAGHSKIDSSLTEKTERPVTRNKFFKSKIPGGSSLQKIHLTKKLVVPKRVKNHKQTRVKESIEFLPTLRQATLAESFERSGVQSRLRPRKTVKDYRDSVGISKILEKSISPNKRNSVVLLERFDRPQECGKVPVYKSVKLSEKDTEDKESIYEFDFDANDPGETKNGNKTRKKKRAPRKAAPVKKKKILPKEDSDVPEKLIESSKNSAATEEDRRGIAGCDHVDRNELPRVGIGNRRENTAGCDYDENNELPHINNENDKKVIVGKNKDEQIKPPHVEIENNDQSSTKENVCTENLPLKENVKMNTPKPKVYSIESLTGNRKVSFKPAVSLSQKNSTKFNPFRSTQSIFKPRPTLNPKDMMDHSLLNKSLSPIKNDLNNFDVASPWRSQLGNTFSSVKQVFQSTPRIDRNLARPSLAGFKQAQRILENDENENITDVEGAKMSSVVKQSENKLVKPLGNRSSNAENIQASSNAAADVSRIGERKSFGQSSNYGENKQHSGFGDRLYKSPIKNDKAVTMSRGSIGFIMRNQELPTPAVSSKKPRPRSSTRDDNSENLPPEEEVRLLKQSNLNSFLNIDDVPESTMINTSHGIFGDANSTPIVSNKVQTRPSIENCFGFDDDNSDTPETSVKLDKSTTPVKKRFERLKERVVPVQTERPSSSVVKPARISLGEIKNTLQPRKEMKYNNPELKDEKTKKKPLICTVQVSQHKKTDDRSRDVSNTAQFCDTFDILPQSEHENQSEKSVSDIGLFADLEPVHFTQPPRWSYAKKRERTEYWSTEGEEDMDDEEKRPVLKKKKLTKVKKANDEKINEWVKSVNDTFQEIDQYDLIVEKRS